MHTPSHLQNLVRAEVQPREHIAPAFHHIRKARVVNHHRVESLHVERALAGRRHRQQEGFLRFALEEWPNHANRLAAVVERHLHPRIPRADIHRDFFHTSARRQKDANPPTLADGPLNESIIKKRDRFLPLHLYLRCLRWIKGTRLHHGSRVQVARVEAGINRRREPDEPATGPFAKCEAELELRRCLVDLVYNQGVVRPDVTVLEPAARDAGGNDYHVPARRLGRGLAFAVHHADA